MPEFFGSVREKTIPGRGASHQEGTYLPDEGNIKRKMEGYELNGMSCSLITKGGTTELDKIRRKRAQQAAPY